MTPVVVNVATRFVTSVLKGIVAVMVFAVSLIVATTPFRENAVIALAEGIVIGSLLQPQTAITMSNTTANTPNIFFMIISFVKRNNNRSSAKKRFIMDTGLKKLTILRTFLFFLYN